MGGGVGGVGEGGEGLNGHSMSCTNLSLKKVVPTKFRGDEFSKI